MEAVSVSSRGRLGRMSGGGRLGSMGRRRPAQEGESLTIRLCHMKKKAGETGYGFNIMSKRDKLCQYVGKVDAGTPAYDAGLRTGDKIIEIDNKNVSEMSYLQIMELLRKGRRIGTNMYRPDELLLLVVDQSTDDFFRRAKIPVSSQTADVPIEFKSSLSQPQPQQQEEPHELPQPPASPSTSSSISSASEVVVSSTPVQTPVVAVSKHTQTKTQTQSQIPKSQSHYDTWNSYQSSSKYRQSPQPKPQPQQQVVKAVEPYSSRCEFAPSLHPTWNERSAPTSSSHINDRRANEPAYHHNNYYNYNRINDNHTDESDDVVDEISININLNSPGVAGGSSSGGGYSNASSSLNSSATTSNDDIEQITFV